MLNVKTGSIDHVTLKFEMHLRPFSGEEGPKTPILMPYVKFSLFDFDEADNTNGREVSRAPWRCP